MDYNVCCPMEVAIEVQKKGKPKPVTLIDVQQYPLNGDNGLNSIVVVCRVVVVNNSDIERVVTMLIPVRYLMERDQAQKRKKDENATLNHAQRMAIGEIGVIICAVRAHVVAASHLQLELVTIHPPRMVV